MAARVHLPSSSKPESNSTSHPPLLPSPSPRSHLRTAPVVSSSSCCPRRRPRRPPPPAPPRPNLSVSATADAAADDLSRARETPAYLWRKDEKWHPVSYDGFSATTAAAAAAAASTTHPRRIRRRNPKKKPSNNPNPSSRMFSSDDDDGEEEDEEDEMLVSSTEDNSFEMTELRLRRAAMMEGAKSMESRTTSPGRRLSPCLGGEGESLAVVKQSEDPRSDFRRSMAEMVVEKGIYEAKELEQLLHCFLSLNSQHHHQAIIDAFTDVWVALFPATPFTRSPGQGNGSLWQSGNEGE